MVDQGVRDGLTPPRKRLEAVCASVGVNAHMTVLPSQRLSSEIGEDVARSGLLATGTLLHGEQDVVVEIQGGAHTSDANALQLPGAPIKVMAAQWSRTGGHRPEEGHR